MTLISTMRALVGITESHRGEMFETRISKAILYLSAMSTPARLDDSRKVLNER